MTSSAQAGPFGGTSTTSGTGSGIVLRSDGTILTNDHVVAGATAVTVTLADGTSSPATIVGADPSSDLAVLRADGLGDLTAAVFADSDELAVGQSVLADGTADHPLLGVSVGEPANATSTGAVLTGVTAGGPAQAAGLQAGDVVTRVDDRAVVDADSLIVAVRDHAPGATVEVSYVRDGRQRTTSATLSSTD